MRVLIADRFSEDARASLHADGVEVCYTPDVRDDALSQAIADTTGGCACRQKYACHL